MSEKRIKLDPSYCNRCGKRLAFIKPLIICNIADGWDNSMDTCVLCYECKEKLVRFLDGVEI